MSVLSDKSIRNQLKLGRLVVNPLLEPIQPTSIDLRLGNSIIIPKGGHIIDPMYGMGTSDVPQKLRFGQTHLLLPGKALLAATLESVVIPPNMIGILVGKSSLARLFLQIEAAGFVDPAWVGKLTLEIKNLGEDTFVLRPGMQICQIVFQWLDNQPEHLYGDLALNSHYQGSTQVQSASLSALVSPEMEADPASAAESSGPS